MTKWDDIPKGETIEKTILALKANGIDAFFVENSEEAKKKVLSMIPDGAEVMNASSVTVDTVGLKKEILESGRFNPVMKKLMSMDRNTQGSEMRKFGAAPDWVIGSVHAVTEDGKILVASNTGSQLPGYAYGAGHVIWIVGAQKIVKNLDEALKRLYEHTLPLEDARMRKAYGMGSNVSKMLIVNKEIQPGRITLIFVKENIGF